MSDSPITPKALRDLRPARHVGRRLAHRLGAVGDVQPGPEESVDAFIEVEAPDNETVARISVELGARGTVQLTTLAAIPVDAFTKMLKTRTDGA